MDSAIPLLKGAEGCVFSPALETHPRRHTFLPAPAREGFFKKLIVNHLHYKSQSLNTLAY